MTYRIRVEPDLEADRVVIDRHRYPPRVELHATSDQGEPEVFAAFELREKKPTCVEFRMVASPNGRGVRPRDMGAWSPSVMAFNVFQQCAQLASDPIDWPPIGPEEPGDFDQIRDELGGLPPSARSTPERAPAPRKRGRPPQPPGDEELREVARLYAANVDDNPTEAVQRGFPYASRGTAARRVQQARAAGFLSPTTPGKRQI